MTIGSAEELEALARICRIVAACLKHMQAATEPGMTTKELDDVGAAFLEAHGARSAPMLTYGFPGATCISVNNEVAHGIPGSRVIRAGDLVNVDVSAEMGGFYGDTGGSFAVGSVTAQAAKLLASTKRARDEGIAEAVAGRPIRNIGRAVEKRAKADGFSIIRNLGSHGVGRGLHEEPEFIAPYYDAKDRRMLMPGMVITVEPFLSTGATNADELADGWTLATPKKYLTAQFEHTIVVTKDAPIILTA